MPIRDRALWALAAFSSLALLMAPALWNGFALLQYDTGGYLARWYEGILVPSRAVVYGLILNAGVPFALWPVVAAQAAAAVWVIALTLRAHRLGGRPWLLLGVVAMLSVATTLPWLTSILLTDIFAGLSVLALDLLVLRDDTLTRIERIGLIVLTAIAAATHSATFAVLAVLMAAAIIVFMLDRKRIPEIALGRGVIALVLGAVLVLGANFIVAKRLAWTPGGFALSFGRMLQDGIVKKYLDEHCPDPALQLCAYKDRLPVHADVWFWGSDLFDRLGRFAGLGKEMEKIALRSLAAYPGLQIETAAVATARQLVAVRSGEGVTTALWHSYAIVERFTPQLAPAMHAARQQRGELSFDAINRLHYPIALLSMALLPVLLLLARRHKIPAGMAELSACVTLALIANAFVCGALSNPHDRYGARMVWIASLVVALAALHRLKRQTACGISSKPAGL